MKLDTARESVVALNGFKRSRWKIPGRKTASNLSLIAFLALLKGSQKRLEPKEILIVLVPSFIGIFNFKSFSQNVLVGTGRGRVNWEIYYAASVFDMKCWNCSYDWYVLASHQPQLSAANMALTSQHYLYDRYGKTNHTPAI